MAVGAVLAGASALGGLANYAASEKQTQEMRRGRKEAAAAEAARQARIAGIASPDLQEYDIPFYDNRFEYTPEMMQAIQQDPSLLESYQADPRFQESQIAALNQLAEMSEGGLTRGDQLAMQEAQIQASQADRGRQEAILQGLARRGMAGGGQELAARLSSSQQASDQAASQQRGALIGAQQRALQAIGQRGQLAGDIRGQGFQEAAARAQAADAINRFNVQNRMNTQASNIDARNRAALMRTEAAQRTSDLNRGVREAQLGQRNQISQQEYNNALSREGLMGPTNTAIYDRSGEAAARARGIGRAVQGAAGAAGYFGSPGSDYDDIRNQQLGDRQGPAYAPGV